MPIIKKHAILFIILFIFIVLDLSVSFIIKNQDISEFEKNNPSFKEVTILTRFDDIEVQKTFYVLEMKEEKPSKSKARYNNYISTKKGLVGYSCWAGIYFEKEWRRFNRNGKKDVRCGMFLFKEGELK